jgi:hypothetical protein
MTEPLRQYEPIQVVASWATVFGSIDVVDGAVEGEFLGVAMDNKRWSIEGDRAGNATRVKNNRRTGTVTITLSASSPTNAVLSALAQVDDGTENVVGLLLIKDLSGTTLIEADGAFIEDIPDLGFGSDRGSRVWVFRCASVTKYVGGHDLA